MMAEHGISVKGWSKAPMSNEVLSIVDKILPDDSGVSMTENSLESLDDCEFFIFTPVTFRPFDAHERDADGAQLVERDANAGDVAAARFNVAADASGALVESRSDLGEKLHNLREVRTDYEIVVRSNYHP
jgi:hypothetical protein